MQTRKQNLNTDNFFDSIWGDSVPDTQILDMEKEYAKNGKELLAYVRQRKVLDSKHKVYMTLLSQSLEQKSIVVCPTNTFMAWRTKLDVKTVTSALKWLADKKFIQLGIYRGKKNRGRAIKILERKNWSSEIVE